MSGELTKEELAQLLKELQISEGAKPEKKKVMPHKSIRNFGRKNKEFVYVQKAVMNKDMKPINKK